MLLGSAGVLEWLAGPIDGATCALGFVYHVGALEGVAGGLEGGACALDRCCAPY